MVRSPCFPDPFPPTKKPLQSGTLFLMRSHMDRQDAPPLIRDASPPWATNSRTGAIEKRLGIKDVLSADHGTPLGTTRIFSAGKTSRAMTAIHLDGATRIGLTSRINVLTARACWALPARPCGQLPAHPFCHPSQVRGKGHPPVSSRASCRVITGRTLSRFNPWSKSIQEPVE